MTNKNTEETAIISDMEVPQIDRSQAVAVAVTFRRLGDKREGSMDEVSTSASKAMTRLVKSLFASSIKDGDKPDKCKEYEAIRNFDATTYLFMMAQTVSLLGRRNVRLLKADGVQVIDDYLTRRVDERALLVNAFVNVYPLIVENAKSLLNGQFRASDYVDEATIRSKFSMEWEYLALGVPENLPESVQKVFADKAEKSWAATASEIRDGLRVGMVQLVDHLVDRLNAKDTDKKSRFHESTIGNVLEFIDALERRDLTNDKALQAVADKAKALIEGASIKDIKSDRGARADMIEKMTEVKVATDALLTPEKRRKFFLED